ncbi:unnamed protein product [Lampetra fluviatilis]
MPEQQRDSEDEDVMRDSTGIQVITQELNDLSTTIRNEDELPAGIRITQLMTNRLREDRKEADLESVSPNDRPLMEYIPPPGGQTDELQTNEGEHKGKSVLPSDEAKATQPIVTQKELSTEPPETTKALDPDPGQGVSIIEEQIEQQIEAADGQTPSRTTLNEMNFVNCSTNTTSCSQKTPMIAAKPTYTWYLFPHWKERQRYM